jgi:hypothetical protein
LPTLGDDLAGRWLPVSGVWTYDAGRFVQSNRRPEGTPCFLREPVVSDFTLTAQFFTYPEGQ